MLSRNLEKSLHRALAHANERRHEYATLDHLLLALTEDEDAVAVMSACSVDLDRFCRGVLNYVDNELANLVATNGDDAKPTASFQRVLQRAAIHVQSSGREKLTGANVLVAMFAERENHAVCFLQEQGVTRFDAVNYVSHGVAKAPQRSSPADAFRAAAGEPTNANRLFGEQALSASVEERLAFLKAQLGITDAQMALWDSFAEAVRDIVKATLRGRIVDLPPTLPERLAAREKNLATDLEVQRQWGAAVQPFYAGLSEEQKQGTDELMVRLFGV